MATGNASAPLPYRSVVPSQVSPMRPPAGINRAAGVGTGAATGAGIGSAIFPGIGTAIGAGAGALASIFGSKKQSQANKDANQYQARYNDQALQAQLEQQKYDREQAALERTRQAANDAEARREFDTSFGYRQSQDALAQANLENERGFTRNEFANYKGRLDPFRQAGANALGNVASVVGRNLPASIPTAGRGGMVSLKAPNGQIQQVPSEHLDWYLSRGATKV